MIAKHDYRKMNALLAIERKKTYLVHTIEYFDT